MFSATTRLRILAKVFGRLRIKVDATEVLALLEGGKSYRETARQLKISVGLAHGCSKKEPSEPSSEKRPRNGVHKTDDC